MLVNIHNKHEHYSSWSFDIPDKYGVDTSIAESFDIHDKH
jgi:hypothetical protein